MDPHSASITLCAAAAAGALLVTLSDRLRVPSIALLLVGGVLLGPEVLGIVQPDSLGRGLEVVVTLAIGIILFEGGLTLDIAGFRREPRVITRMLTAGVMITWSGVAITVHLVFGMSVEMSVVAGSLLIVTGPTVVSPLLRRMRVQTRLHHVLYWEGVLVDAVGVFCAVLCFEYIAASADASPLVPVGRFASRFIIGTGIGLGAGLVLSEVLRRRWVSAGHTNVVVLAAALLALGIANAILYEAGILAVIVAGLVVSFRGAPQLEGLRRFKLELTELGIGLLFILLAAKLELARFVEHAPELGLLLLVVLFVIRPLNILLVTWGQQFSWREKAFLAWLAPRGIVAASMASLFALRLSERGFPGAVYLETITYAVIAATVLGQGLSAPAVARLLGLERPRQGAWLLIGDASLAVSLHQAIRRANARAIAMATDRGLVDHDHDPSTEPVEMSHADPTKPSVLSDAQLASAEAVVAMCTDPALNNRVCTAWADVVGAPLCFRWGPESGSEPAGTPVWTALPSPTDVRSAFDARTMVFDAVEPGDEDDRRRFGKRFRPMLTVNDGTVAIAPPGELPDETEWVIVLRDRIPTLYGLIHDVLVIDAKEPTFADTVDALLELAVRTMPGINVQTRKKEILERERTMPTALGGGVAIPHIYQEGADTSVCFVANVINGLDTAGPDEQKVRLVFLVISPSDQPHEHLLSLAAIANLVSDETFVDVLARKRTRGHLLALIRERE